MYITASTIEAVTTQLPAVVDEAAAAVVALRVVEAVEVVDAAVTEADESAVAYEGAAVAPSSLNAPMSCAPFGRRLIVAALIFAA